VLVEPLRTSRLETLAEACVKYLHCTYTDTYYHKWDELVAMIPKHPFLQYAVQNWHHHVRLADLNDDNPIHQLVHDLLRRGDDLPYFWLINGMFDLYARPWTPLMKASYLGLSQAAMTLLQSDNVKPNSMQKFDRSRLSLAAENGHENDSASTPQIPSEEHHYGTPQMEGTSP
jgi:hypothetical protein